MWIENDYYEDYNYIPDEVRKAMLKNDNLIENFEDKQKHQFCSGAGVRVTKLFLNKKIKEGDKIAEAYRQALELGHVNIQAKEARYPYKDKIYDKKNTLLDKFILFCIENNFTVGYQKHKAHETSYIVYFELPDMEQISFHTNLTKDIKSKMKVYPKEWDGKVNSTMGKIEESVSKIYGDEIDAYRKHLEENAARKKKKAETAKKTV